MKNRLKLLCVVLVFLFSSVTSASGSGIATLEGIIPADRRIDWSYAGIPGGIPERTTICKTIDSAVYGNGKTDATAVIQAALKAYGDDKRKVAKLLDISLSSLYRKISDFDAHEHDGEGSGMNAGGNGSRFPSN